MASNDTLGQFTFFGHDGAALRQGAGIVVSTIAATPSSTDMQSRFVAAALRPAGSVVPTEIMRADHASGLSAFGANPFLDQNRHFRLRSYTHSRTLAGGQRGSRPDDLSAPTLGGGGGLVCLRRHELAAGVRGGRGDGRQRCRLHADAAVERAGDQLTPGTLTAEPRGDAFRRHNAYSGARFRHGSAPCTATDHADVGGQLKMTGAMLDFVDSRQPSRLRVAERRGGGELCFAWLWQRYVERREGRYLLRGNSGLEAVASSDESMT